MTAGWAPGWTPGQPVAAFSAVAASRSVSLTDRYLEVDATTGSIVLSLPSAVGCPGETFTFIRTDAATVTNTVTIAAAAGETIGGASSQLLVFTDQILTVVSNGQKWLVCYSNYRGTELAYAETTTPATTTNTSGTSTVMAANTIPGLSFTVIGAGRPVALEFFAYCYNSTVDIPVGVAFIINGSTVNSMWAFGHNHLGSGVGFGESVYLPRRPLLAAGTSYTFQVGMWCQSGTGHFYADTTTPLPMYMRLVGQ